MKEVKIIELHGYNKDSNNLYPENRQGTEQLLIIYFGELSERNKFYDLTIYTLVDKYLIMNINI